MGQTLIFRSENASSQGTLLEIHAKESGRGILRIKKRVKKCKNFFQPLLPTEGGGNPKEEAGPEKQYKKAKL